MPVNKGLLISAAFANGLQSFLDAREKGDLKRQQQALADAKKLMSDAQLKNLDLTGQRTQQLIDFDEMYRPGEEERANQTARTRLLTAEAAKIRAERPPKPTKADLPSLNEKLMRSWNLYPVEGESNEGWGQRFGQVYEGLDDWQQQVVGEELGWTGTNWANIEGTTQHDDAIRREEAHNKKIEEINRKAEESKKLSPQEKVKLVDWAKGLPQYAGQIAGMATHEDAMDVFSSPDLIAAVLSRKDPIMVKTGQNGVLMVDGNDPDAPHTVLVEPSPGLDYLDANEIMALTDRPQKLAQQFKTRPVTRYYDKVKQGYEAMNIVAKKFMEKRVTPGVFDLTLANQFRKLLDPPSVVRNSENEAVKRAMGLVQQVSATVQAFRAGGNFEHSMRVSIMNAISGLMEGTNHEYNRSYEEQAVLVRLQMGVTESFRPRIAPDAWKYYKFDVETVLGKPPISPVDKKTGKGGVPTYSKPVDISLWQGEEDDESSTTDKKAWQSAADKKIKEFQQGE